MRSALHLILALGAATWLCGCAEMSKTKTALTKYDPVRIYPAPIAQVYEAARQAMAAENYKLEVGQLNEAGGSATLVTGYMTIPSTVHFYTDDKGEKKPCQVKYLIHADLRSTEDGHTRLELLIPEVTEFHKPDIGPVWQKTDTLSWRGRRLQNMIADILAGRSPTPSASHPTAEKKEKE